VQTWMGSNNLGASIGKPTDYADRFFPDLACPR
jgi:hypothetical protein